MKCCSLIWNLFVPDLTMPVIPAEINKVEDHRSHHNDFCQMCALQITSYLCQDSCVLRWVNKQHHLNGLEKREEEKKEQLKAPRSFLMCGTKRMELTAVHNHLRFRHGGSC